MEGSEGKKIECMGMKGSYYNENDPFAAAWLRELLKANLIAPGEVDERSVEQVQPDDLREFTQCHFFAGAGVWSYALRSAGWPDDRPVWTGSCPCPSFSAAGQGKGFEDPRHLWPRWFGLIRESRPATIFGEQADKAIGFGWLDLVQTDLEAQGYAVGATVFGAHSVGAPHIRQRLYFVGARKLFWDEARCGCWDRDAWHRKYGMWPWERCDNAGFSAHAEHRRQAIKKSGPESRCGNGISIDANGPGPFTREQAGEGMGYRRTTEPAGGTGDSLDTEEQGLEGHGGDVREWRGPGWLDPLTARSVAEAGATRGYWSDCDWWYGRDGKYRPIGAGLFPLVAGATGRMGKLRGYGNALCAPQAQAFIESYMSLNK